MRQLESFFWGIIAALGALFVQLVIFVFYSTFTNQSNDYSFLNFFLIPQIIILFAFLEEFFKYIIISRRVEMYSLEKSFIVNSMFVGLGFFAMEVLIIANSLNLPSVKIFSELAMVHIGTAGIIGYLVAVLNLKKMSGFLYMISLVTIFHAGYNFLILEREYIQNLLVYFLLGILIFSNLFNFLRISRKLA